MNIVFDEIKKLLVPCFVQTVLIYGIFAYFGYGNIGVFATLVFSTIYSLLNFWILGAAISTALSKSPVSAQVYMVMQYFVRYIITGGILYYAVILPSINPLAVALPMFFPKTSLILRSLTK